MKFNGMGVKLINARYQHISLIKKNIDKGKNIKTIPIEDIDFKSVNLKKYVILNKPNLIDKEIAYCLGLPFGILTFNCYVDSEKIYIICFDVKINSYKLLCINTLSLSYSF